ncbi:helix-turn-helix domain-containing protein [Microbacterium sp. PM5]|uniref:helix-turn-helix transcriptional regulator n=1 Tax=Microbacterium sp. PM5 TaxID=2014534 RepID=UPI000DD15F21|nr:helix-turn-helix domain-containing protein [Microbacterium sp. PM5]AXA95417.1 hypothetical protein CEP17_02730 [Microbacterium sp. PM5]
MTAQVAVERRGPVLTTDRAAEYIGVSTSTLYTFVSLDARRPEGAPRRGPKAFKQGKKNVFYPVDLDAWLAEHVTDPEAQS